MPSEFGSELIEGKEDGVAQLGKRQENNEEIAGHDVNEHRRVVEERIGRGMHGQIATKKCQDDESE